MCLLSQCHGGVCRETLSGGFSFCGPPHVAHPCCLPPLMLDVCWKFARRRSQTEGWRRRGDFSEDHQRFLCFGTLTGWFTEMRSLSLSLPPSVSLSVHARHGAQQLSSIGNHTDHKLHVQYFVLSLISWWGDWTLRSNSSQKMSRIMLQAP